MRHLPFLLLLAACGPGKITLGDGIGDDTGHLDTGPGPASDADGDGYASLDAGGPDCDDANPTVHPGATEVWYDGTDQDCNGGSDYDQDADGADAAPQGGDCDDLHADVYPGATESRDLVDQDCDGLVDEDFLSAGIVLITEIMHHPLETSDADGEWFEIVNTDANAVDLVGWTISGDDGDSITIASSLVVSGGGRIVLGASSNTGSNGGVLVDYTYDRSTLSLSSEDTLFLAAGSLTIFDVEWTAAWTSTDGASLSLDPDHLELADARQPTYWCVAKTRFGDGDLGTPGEANDDCTNIDEDGDGWSVDEGDCNDADRDISPGDDEIWDGIDNDCSGSIDEAEIGDIAVGYLDGSPNTFLSVHSGLGLGDVTGDGTPDLLAGGIYQNTYAGAIYVVDGDDHDSVAGQVTNYDLASAGGSNYSYLGATSPLAGDVTGDGIADVVVGGSGYVYYSDVAAVIVAGGRTLSGSHDSSDADMVIFGAGGQTGYAIARVDSSLDLDGDGVNDLVLTDSNRSTEAKNGSGYVWVFASGTLSAEMSVEDADGVYYGGSSQDYVGIGIGGADFDRDGYDDLLVGASGADDGANNGGAWYQIDGGTSLAGDDDIAVAADRIIGASHANDGIGFGAPAIGDFDDDGHPDLAFGGYQADAVWMFSGLGRLSQDLETDDADLVISGDGPGTFGFAVTAGDFDGDGTDDLAAGAPAVTNAYSYTPAYWYYAVGNDFGELYVFGADALSRSTLDASDADATATGQTRGDLFGSVMSGAADIDGDGADDLLVSAPRGGSNGAGRAYVLKMR